MDRRLQLQSLLEQILGSRNVYFQPPANVKMSYPCIVYSRDYADSKFASNLVYDHTLRYQVTVIDPDPDSEILPKVASLPMCLYTRYFASEGLNHDIYSLYF